jgi:acyl-coenzyme A synthetase/AMP-(fatty) acid ligase
MLNVAGKRFSLGELTARLAEIEGVDDAVAFLPDARDDIERPVALVVSELAPREIARRLARTVDAAFIPRPIIRVAQIPRNATGKVLRATLIELFGQHQK